MKVLLFLLIPVLVVAGCTSKTSRSKEHLNKGIIEMYESRFDAAIIHFKQAIELDPESYEAYFQYGNCLYTTGKHQEAMQAYDQTVSLNPSFADAYYNRGLLKEMFGDKEGACIDYKKAEELGKPNVSDKTRFCF